MEVLQYIPPFILTKNTAIDVLYVTSQQRNTGAVLWGVIMYQQYNTRTKCFSVPSVNGGTNVWSCRSGESLGLTDVFYLLVVVYITPNIILYQVLLMGRFVLAARTMLVR